MFHLHNSNLIFLGLAYDLCEPECNIFQDYKYGVTYFELYKCKKCGKLIRRNSDCGNLVTLSDLYEKIEQLERIGYLPLGKVVDSINLIKSEVVS